MGIVDETLKVLERIPIWKRLGQIPAEVDDLQKRVAALEEKLGGKWPADVCKYCGERAVRLADQRHTEENWVCAVCGETELRKR